MQTARDAKMWVKRCGRQMWCRLRWFAPDLIPLADPADTVHRQAREEEANRNTRAPADEGLRLRAVWGMEVFGPNEGDHLYEALAKLGWSSDPHGKEGALTWARQRRSYGIHGGDWYNVGNVVRRSDRRFHPRTNFAPLPDQVDYLQVRLRQIAPSITCMVVCFVLKPREAAQYEVELNLDRSSFSLRGQRWSIAEFGPVHVKQEAVHRLRSGLQKMVAEWFAQNAAGFFCSLNQPERFPTTELLTTKVCDIFADREERPYFTWQKILVNAAPYDVVWTSEELPGLRFSIEPSRWPLENRHHLIVNLVTSSIPTELLAAYGGAPHAYALVTHERIEGLLAQFATTAYLLEAAKEIKVMRDSMRASKTTKQVLETIHRIQRFFDRNIGLPAATRELVEHSASRISYHNTCTEFTARALGDGTCQWIADWLRQRVQTLARRLLDDESSTREQFEQLSTILSVRESIRAQKRMECLTILACVISFLSMVTALFALTDKWPAWVAGLCGAWHNIQKIITM